MQKNSPKASGANVSALKVTKGDAKRTKIIEAAAIVFGEKGYSTTTLNHIAMRVNTHPGSLYYYFASREALVKEVLKESMRMSVLVKEAIGRAPIHATHLDRIVIGIEAHLDSTLSADSFLSAYNRIINEVPEAIREEFKEIPRQYGHYWHGLITEAQAAGEIKSDLDPTLLRMILFGSMTWAQLWFKPNGRNSLFELKTHIAKIFLDGSRS